MDKKEIIAFFDELAPCWDKTNVRNEDIISEILQKGGIRNGAKVLDVACGTGDFTIEIAQKVADGSEVIGIDLSDGMMKIGREKIAAAGVSATMVQGDCEELPYGDATFDRISVGFGVRNFEHLEVGLAEMCRVLKQDGKLVILELSVPSNAFVRWCYKLYFLKILPTVGGWVSGDRGAYEYLPASVLRFPAPDKFMGMMREAGFKNVTHKALTFGICRMYIGKKQ